MKTPKLISYSQMDALTWLMDEAEGPEMKTENLAIRVLLIIFGASSTTALVRSENEVLILN